MLGSVQGQTLHYCSCLMSVPVHSWFCEMLGPSNFLLQCNGLSVPVTSSLNVMVCLSLYIPSSMYGTSICLSVSLCVCVCLIVRNVEFHRKRQGEADRERQRQEEAGKGSR